MATKVTQPVKVTDVIVVNTVNSATKTVVPVTTITATVVNNKPSTIINGKVYDNDLIILSETRYSGKNTYVVQ